MCIFISSKIAEKSQLRRSGRIRQPSAKLRDLQDNLRDRDTSFLESSNSEPEIVEECEFGKPAGMCSRFCKVVGINHLR